MMTNTTQNPHEYRITLSESFLSSLDSWAVKDALEIGAGDGKNMMALRERGYRVDGVEENAALIPKGLDIKTISFNDSLPFPDNTFDLVYSFQYLNHGAKEKIVHVFGEVRRVLRAGGHFVLRITDYEQVNIKPVPGEPDVFQEGDTEFGDMRYRMLGSQLFTKLTGDEAGIPHYAFTEKELILDLETVGFSEINCQKMRWNLKINGKK